MDKCSSALVHKSVWNALKTKKSLIVFTNLNFILILVLIVLNLEM